MDGGKKRKREEGRREGGNMKRIMRNAISNHKRTFCYKLRNRIKSNLKIKIILVYVKNIKCNYQDYPLDFVHNSFPHYARKYDYFLKGQ